MKIMLSVTILFLVSICTTKAQPANRYDVIIDEIMADPLPSVGLPNTEYIELKNIASKSFDLFGWQLGNATSLTTISNHYMLQPDSFIVVCSNNAATQLSIFGKSIGVANFPSLNNDAGLIYLLSNDGITLHAIEYNSGWYKNALKKEGGWSLEMIDTKNPCGGIDNWTASTDPKGGTPGIKNSVSADNPDLHPPSLIKAYAIDSVTISLFFDEPLDSGSAISTIQYLINEGIGNPVSVTVIPPVFNTVQLTFKNVFGKSNIYQLSCNGIADCSGNVISLHNQTRLGLSADADSFDIVINEILFNPRPTAVDYVEIYNRSNKIIDLAACYIANRNNSGAISSITQISQTHRLLFPTDYLVVTEDAVIVERNYLVKQPDAFAVVGSLPSMPNDKGDVILLNAQGRILDELAYDEHWHFKLITNDEGVALERINYNYITQDASNWHSASTDAGYGTPTYRNSQYSSGNQAVGTISITPSIFSPDNDGFDDFLTINYQFPSAGYTCNITIFDASGRPVKYLTHNAICGLQGYFRWDGLDAQNHLLPIGVYVIYTSVFNLQGKTASFKNAITLARRL